MTYIVKPVNHHPNLEKNALGLTRRDYEGTISTLCAGCGHDSISAAVIEACYDLSLASDQIAKLSGIGCSSKSPSYFLNQAHGFNSVHGRMPSVATGANLGNQDLMYLGVSGDGDTAGIGIGQFMHAARRQLNITYIVENNGTYGLTKGQFSATNDQGSKSKYGEENVLAPIDLAAMAIQLGAGFVGRSFSGDKDQLVPLLKAAMKFKGFSLIDIISPCVTFNNHAGSTKSYDHIREHNESVSSLDFVPIGQEIKTSYKEGSKVDVPLHDGAILTLEKLSKKYNELLLKSMLEMPKISLKDADKTNSWCQELQDKMNNNSSMAESHSLSYSSNAITYIMRTYGVETNTAVLDEAFFGSKDYKNIESYSSEVESMFTNESYIQKSSKETKTPNFSTAIEFLLNEARKGQGFQRYKGLGEMNPDQLWETTMNPETRVMLRVKIEDAIASNDVFTTLMGDEVEPRRNFIEDNALKVDNLDF